MFELFIITGSIYFVFKSWSVYQSAGQKAKAAYAKAKTKPQPHNNGLSPDELAKLRSLLGSLK